MCSCEDSHEHISIVSFLIIQIIDRVLVLPVDQHFVVKNIAGGVPGSSYGGDLLSLGYGVAHRNSHGIAMRIFCSHTVTMIDDHQIAKAALITGEGYETIRSRINRSSLGVSQIHTHMAAVSTACAVMVRHLDLGHGVG